MDEVWSLELTHFIIIRFMRNPGVEVVLRKVFLKVCEGIERREQGMERKVKYFGMCVQ